MSFEQLAKAYKDAEKALQSDDAKRLLFEEIVSVMRENNIASVKIVCYTPSWNDGDACYPLVFIEEGSDDWEDENDEPVEDVDRSSVGAVIDGYGAEVLTHTLGDGYTHTVTINGEEVKIVRDHYEDY